VHIAPAAANASAAARTARKHPSPSGRCAVNINVAPREMNAGDSLIVFGRLRCHGHGLSNALAGQTVRLLEHTPGTTGFRVVQSTTTDERGFYELTVAGVTLLRHRPAA
jgi:hypothetical protein